MNAAAQKIADAVSTITDKESLRELHKIVAAQFNLVHRAQMQRAVFTFRVGDLVTFKLRNGSTVKARITAKNRTTLSVEYAGPVAKGSFPATWRVTPSLCTKVSR